MMNRRTFHSLLPWP